MFSDIKKGDKVILVSKRYINDFKMRNFYEQAEIEKVNKITLQVQGKLYCKNTGLVKTNGGDEIRIEPFRQEKLAHYIELERQYQVIQNAFTLMTKTKRLTYEKACKIIEILGENNG